MHCPRVRQVPALARAESLYHPLPLHEEGLAAVGAEPAPVLSEGQRRLLRVPGRLGPDVAVSPPPQVARGRNHGGRDELVPLPLGKFSGRYIIDEYLDSDCICTYLQTSLHSSKLG